jgi:uncharacterized Tic20 family protein
MFLGAAAVWWVQQELTLFVEHKARDGVFRTCQQRMEAFISFALILVSIFWDDVFLIPNVVIMGYVRLLM